MLEWRDGNSFVLGDTLVRLVPEGAAHSTPDTLVLRKPRWMVEEYLALAEEFRGASVFELGINEGGSTAFLAELLAPRSLVAIEIAPEPNPTLAAFLDDHGLGASVHPRYGVDQSDHAALERLVASEVADPPFDMVIDDASHSLDETRVSFDALFPRLRPGGAFVLEDWSWDHTWERALRADAALFERLSASAAAGERAVDERRGLSRLVLDVVLASGYSDDVVSGVSIRRGFVVVRRGPAELDHRSFAIADCYGEVRRRILAASD